MVNIRLLSIVLGLLFVLHGVIDFPSALAQDAASDGEVHAVSARKELADDHGVTVISMRKLWLQGRKMASHMLWKEYDQKEPKGMDTLKTWKISGKSNTEASNESPGRSHHHQKFYQKNINMLDRKTLKPASLGITWSKQPAVTVSNSKQMKPQDSKTGKTISSLESSSMSDNEVAGQKPLDSDQRDEAQRLLIATKEIENLMQKDYRGMSKPRRRPPINNHQPRH